VTDLTLANAVLIRAKPRPPAPTPAPDNIVGWNDRCHPFTWTKTAEQILTKASRQTASNAGH
jgi:hypothetical protein